MEVGKISNIKPLSAQKPAFKGNPISQGAQSLSKIVDDYLPQGLKKMSKLSCLNGELGGIVVTALGTGAVAPIFIAYNPISKTDKDTRTYTAMRQPVSAVLALLFQAGMIIPVANMLEKAANEGKLGKNPLINKVDLQSEKYLKMKFKKELKDKGELKNLTKEQKNEKIKSLVDAERAAQRSRLVEALKRDGKIEIGGIGLKPEKVSEIIKDTLKKYEAPFKKALTELEHKDVNFKIKRAQTLVNNQKEIKQSMGEILKWEEAVDFRSLLAKMANDAKAAGNNDLADLYSEFNMKNGKVYKCPDLESVKSRAANTILMEERFEEKINQARVIKSHKEEISSILNDIKNSSNPDKIDEIFKNGLSTFVKDEQVKNSILADLAEHNDAISKKAFADNLLNKVEKLANANTINEILTAHQENYYSLQKEVIEHKLDVIKKFIDDTAKSSADGLKKVLDEAGIEIKSLNGNDIYKDVIAMYEKHRDNAFGINKNIKSALIATFIFLPITCTALNWVYPRFMDIFFPSLSKSKKEQPPQKVGNKLDVKEGK